MRLSIVKRSCAGLLPVLALVLAACSGGAHRGAPSTRARATVTTVEPVATPTRPTVASTTTAVVPAAPIRPMSATFVSADDGWLLESDTGDNADPAATCTCRVLRTRDGGRTWVLLALQKLPLREQITVRFADATHGFVFDTTTVLATSDGGAHWQHVATPFTSLQTLEIVRGVVYAIGMVPGDSNFRIFSTPADHLDWTEDALGLPSGAGPVPQQQLVFADGHGWLLNSDRTVIGGARLQTDGQWASWTPPCLTVEGPAVLAASTASDVMALCDEHVYSGAGPTPALYVSHDGGATFARHGAPATGLLATPSPNVAVVASGPTIWRTVNSGETWTRVAEPNPQGDNLVELGFTTPVQGYLILGVAGLFVTRDSGATWSHVTVVT